MIAVPVSLIGTFAVMAMLGFSLNNLSLFGLVLAIGIVVDDAIVVVENVKRYLAMGHPARSRPPRDGRGFRAGDRHCPGALRGLHSTAFMAGISGEFFRQFALTIAASTIISAFNSLTLSPALAAILFKGHGTGHGPDMHGHAKKEALPRLGVVLIAALLAYSLLTPHLAHLLGVQLPGTHGEHPSDGHASAAALWAFGWFPAPQERLRVGSCRTAESRAGRFFAAFNWAFDPRSKPTVGPWPSC